MKVRLGAWRWSPLVGLMLLTILLPVVNGTVRLAGPSSVLL